MRHDADMTDMRDDLRSERKQRFLELYAQCGVIGPAVEAIGVSRTTLGNWRKDDEEFDAAVLDAYQVAVDAAEFELRTRAVTGREEVVLYKGEPIFKRDPDTGEVVLDADFNPMPLMRYVASDRLLEVYIKAHRPRYRDKSGIEVSGPDGGPVATSVTVEFVDAIPRPEPAEDDGEF